MNQEFDVIIIGGGATGLGVAVESISRGYKTLLLEAYDFGKGTSSKSTKLVHGGIRYLANLDFELVSEGLDERFYFLKNAPHIASTQAYLVPFYSFLDKIKYFLGIKLYDYLAKDKKVGQSKFLSIKETIQYAPDLDTNGLKGGAIYYDGQFDDTRMLITLLQTFKSMGGVAYNYHEVTNFIKDSNNIISGVKVFDKLNQSNLEFSTNIVINATGTFTDELLNLDDLTIKHNNVEAAQGTHLVFEPEIFNSDCALVIPKTTDGRILFVLPWHGKVVVGTTDIAVSKPVLDPKPRAEEISFILDTLNCYTNRQATINDIKSVFTGQRPLVRPKNAKNSAKISRKHEILYSTSGLISIVGGKWTIYRKMGEDTINFAINKNLLSKSQSVTKELKLFAANKNNYTYPLNVYGDEVNKILEIQKELSNFDKIHPDLPYFQAEVIYQIRYEMAKTLEDVLVRRTRAIFLDAKATINAAILVATLMATELNLRNSNEWVTKQVEDFKKTNMKYLMP